MRKSKTVHITDEGRDKGKTFFIEEWGAYQAEWWGTRAAHVLAKAGVDLGEYANGGMLAIARAGIERLGFLNLYEAKPLLDEMMTAVQFVQPVKGAAGIPRLLNGQDDIEEVMTILTLRREVFELHTGFLRGASPSRPQEEASEAQTTSTPSGKIIRTRPRP